MMNFGTPGVLWALLALAIPIIIHLFYFRRYKKVYFSSVQFLKEATLEQKKTGRLRNLLILLARLLTFIFLILAFALPFLGNKKTGDSHSGHVVIYLDNTLSMSRVSDNRNLLEQAKDIASTWVSKMDKEQKVLILTHDQEMDKVFTLPSEALQVIESIDFSSSSMSMGDWLKSTSSMLQDMHVEQAQAIFLSDFQSYAWTDDLDSVFSQMVLVPLVADAENISLDSIAPLNPVFHDGSANQLLAYITNHGETERVSQLHLSLDGELSTIQEISIPAHETVVDTLSFVIQGKPWVKGKVSLEDGVLEFDNALYFSVPAPKKKQVLLLEEVGATSAVYDVFRSDENFFVKRQSSHEQADLSTYSLVVLNELNYISTDLEKALTEYVEEGGNLYVIPNLKKADIAYNSLLKSLALGQYGELKHQKVSVAEMNMSEPVVYTAFESIPKNVDLPRLKSFWTLTSSYQTPEFSILKLDHGRPFIQKYQLDKGLVYLQTSTLHSSDNDFTSKAIFAPLVYNFAVISQESSPLYYTMGTRQLITHLDVSTVSREPIKMRAGAYELIPATYPMGRKMGVEIPRNLNRDGFYDVLRAENHLATVAINHQRKESDMSFMTDKQLQEKYGSESVKIQKAPEFLSKNSHSILQNHVRLWKVCVILSIIFLIIEIALIRLFNNQTSSHEI